MGTAVNSDLNEKRFPELKAAGTNINIDDGSNAKVNIATSKNFFSALENEDSDEEKKRPTEIKPAMVQKKKGEFTKTAIKREVDKYQDKDGKPKKKKPVEASDESEEEEEPSEASDEED